MTTKQNRVPKAVWGILSLSFGATLANACGEPFSNCEAHRNCPTTGGTSGQGGNGPNEVGGSGGDDSGNPGIAGGGASGEGGNGGSGGQGSSGGAESGEGGVSSGGATTTEGGAVSTEGGAAIGGESTAGAGGSAVNNPDGGSGGAEADPCDPSPCAHGSTCATKSGHATCACTKGYTGAHCELLVFEGVGVLGGDSTTSGVSGDGTLVTGTSGQAALWSAQTGLRALPVPAAYQYCDANGISLDGTTIVGECGATGTASRPIRWLHGKAEELDPQGTATSYALAANADGSVIVGYQRPSGGKSAAFRWTGSSGVVEIPALVPGEDTYAFASSADGSMVVGVSGTLGYRWSIGSNPQSLGTRDCSPYATNADGSVIVGTMPNENGKAHAFRWTQAEGLVDLGVLSTDPETHAYDTSADGNVIVGESGTEELGEGLLWTKSAGLQPLKTVLTTAGANLTGWRVGTAVGVSANGKVIVGWGTHDGHLEGWIARLP